MKFPYRPIIWFDKAKNSFDQVMRPEIKLIVHGPNESVVYRALVDTGSDDVVLPASIARYLGVAVSPAPRAGRAFGGSRLEFLIGDLELEIRADSQAIRWQTEVKFLEFPSEEDEVLVLGHGGFLEFFTATFDGEQAELTLELNNRFPKSGHVQ